MKLKEFGTDYKDTPIYELLPGGPEEYYLYTCTWDSKGFTIGIKKTALKFPTEIVGKTIRVETEKGKRMNVRTKKLLSFIDGLAEPSYLNQLAELIIFYDDFTIVGDNSLVQASNR